MQELVEHFSTIEALDQLVPFTGSLGVDRFLLWPELEEESRRSADKQNSAVQDGGPLLPRKLKATELLTHPLSNKRLFAVEGAAGVGKTTMARALARFTSAQTLELVERENEDGSQVQYLPLYFNSEDLIKLAARTPVGQVSPSGEDALKDLLGGVLQEPNRALLVIVDGLDEVEGPIRTKALNALRGLWLPGGNHRYLLLGRPGSVSNVPWVREEKAVLKLTLKPWEEEEVREYLGHWTEEGGHPHLEVAELDQLVEYMRSRVGLPSPALLVQMVVASYVELKRDSLENPLEQMPATRTKLYHNYLRLLLERSEGDKALQGAGSTAHPADLERRKWLGCLELLLRLSPEQRERARAQKCSANHLPDVAAARARGRSCGKLLREGADFAKWWEDRKLCRLGHESLHEFLAAEALARLYRGDPQRFWKDWLHPSIFDPYWQQTLIFAIALMNKEDQSALMRGLLALGSCDPVSELTGRHLEVMAKAWGAGARYDQAIWEEWLDSKPHPDLLVAAAANANLRTITLEALERLVREEEDKWVRIEAAQALGEQNPKLAMAVLRRIAQEEGYGVARSWAVQALGSFGPPAISTLKRLAQKIETRGKEGDELLQFEVARALVELHPETALYFLERLAQEGKNPYLCTMAAEELGRLKPEAAIPVLEKLAHDVGNESARAMAAGALGRLKPEAAIPVLGKLAQEASREDARIRAAGELVRLNPEVAITILEKLAHTAQLESSRHTAAILLGQLGSIAIPVLKNLAQEAKYDWVRYWASSKLRNLDPEAAIPALSELAMNAKSDYLRAVAAGEIGHLRPDVAVPVLEELARKAKNEDVRVRAAGWLGYFKPKAAIPFLTKLVQEAENENARIWAAEALEELNTPSPGCED
ncbi:HEAT repeat domain-containing protein [Oceanithermus sp.]|uniref:HEAT repeat domain-containing protein n=1 Tax=Oceanithermus sp. TaxID=2268145 RepID=UPI0025804C28|nr:HEAT repeat domain-containing protein [Oceanithermus sp.]